MTDIRQTLTSVGVILLVIGDQQSIALGGNGLVGEVLILDFSKLDHFGGCELDGRGEMGRGCFDRLEMNDGRTEREFGRSDFFAGQKRRGSLDPPERDIIGATK